MRGGCIRRLSSRCIEQCSRQALCFLKKKVFQCEVFHFNCANPTCDGRLEFDGAELALLNMGSYLLSYEVLRDFMFHFLKGRCTLFYIVFCKKSCTMPESWISNGCYLTITGDLDGTASLISLTSITARASVVPFVVLGIWILLFVMPQHCLSGRSYATH